MRIEQFPMEEEEEPIGGMNPLTMAIALVVITILIAAGLSFWATNLTISKPGPVPKSSCAEAKFGLYSGSYDVSTSTVFLTLNNMGPVDLTDLRVYFIYSNYTHDKPLEGTLSKNIIKSFEVPNVKKDFKQGVIKTQCPEVQLKFINQNGTLQET
ncbi:hypothetical protein DRJ22_05110 [Candidatus Woesearchaeota archaeon]|nr:MAG: hypothetical protein DRJ22_05110 [Candidatus Woesearchaeota archaeon]